MERIFIERPTEESVLKELLGLHVGDFNISKLSAQMRMLPTLCEEKSVAAVAKALSSASLTVREMLSECMKLCKLIICAPTSIATSERSFSHLRYIKNYLRSTMGQPRLTHLMVLHVHRAESRNLDKYDILQEFIQKCSKRKLVFG